MTRTADIAAGPASLAAMIDARPGGLPELLERTGAAVFRGFEIDSEARFASLLDAMGIERAAYTAGNTPRTERSRGVYTATEYSSAQLISLHNELSYSRPWPAALWFVCVRPADNGGATTLADGRRILARLDAHTVDAFRTRGVRYVRNLHAGRGLGRSWQATFATEDKDRVTRACASAGTRLVWTKGGLHLEHEGPGVIEHPQSGELVWFNQAEQFHPSSLPEEVASFLLDEYRGREHQLPQWACFADGEPIPAAMLAEVRAVLEHETVAQDWQRGDVMLVDNVLALHGRRPYSGPREVLVAMA